MHLKGNENNLSNAKLGLGRVEARIGDNMRPYIVQAGAGVGVGGIYPYILQDVYLEYCTHRCTHPAHNGKQKIRTMYRSSAHLGSSEISLRLEESGLHGTQTQTRPATHERTSGQRECDGRPLGCFEFI